MSRTVDPYAALPRYYQLLNILKEKIDNGEWEPHQSIPSERQLEDIYGVSRTTIRQAMGILVRQGYVYQEHGRGTFVSPRKIQKGLQELTSFSEDMLSRGLKPGQKILEIGSVLPPGKVCAHLELPTGCGSVLRIERIRLGDEQPIGLQVSYLSLGENQTITRDELEERGSLYAILQEKFHISLSEAEETLEVTVATSREAELLQMQPGAPLLLSERTLFTKNRRPIEYVKILYRGDRYRYTVRLTR